MSLYGLNLSSMMLRNKKLHSLRSRRSRPHGLHDFDQEPEPVSRRTAILVSPVIDGALQEPVDQVSMASMYFNGIKACMHII